MQTFQVLWEKRSRPLDVHYRIISSPIKVAACSDSGSCLKHNKQFKTDLLSKQQMEYFNSFNSLGLVLELLRANTATFQHFAIRKNIGFVWQKYEHRQSSIILLFKLHHKVK